MLMVFQEGFGGGKDGEVVRTGGMLVMTMSDCVGQRCRWDAQAGIER